MKAWVVGFVAYGLVAFCTFADSYTNTIPAGTSYIANQLDHGSNTFAELFPNNGSLDGNIITKYGCGTNTSYLFDSTSPTGFSDPNTFSPISGGTLSPGEGVKFENVNGLLTIVFTGTAHVPIYPSTNPAVTNCFFSQTNLLSRQTNDIGNYQNITGYLPQTGSQVFIWTGSSFNTFTYGSNSWSPNEPTLAVGQSAFFLVPTNSSAAGLVFQGITNTPVRHASLAMVGNLLYVTNLDSSGQDGVSIGLPASLTALDVQFQDPDPINALPVGAYVQSQMIGTASGITNGVLGKLTATKSGTNNYVVSADFSAVGASTYTVQAYNQGVLVAQATNQNAASVIILPPLGPFSLDIENFDFVQRLSIDFAFPIFATIAGQPAAFDHLVYTPENIAITNPPTALQIVASQIPGLSITSENVSLMYQGLTNTSLGNASLALASSNQLVVSNLGSSGQDGVTLALSPIITDWSITLDSPDVSNAMPVGAYLQEQIVGTANGITNGVLGTVRFTKTATTNYVISTDYSPFGASSYVAQAYLNGNLVGQVTNQGGLNQVGIAVSDQALTGGKGVRSAYDVDGHDYYGYPMLSFVPIKGQVFLTSNGPAMNYDHLYISPLGGAIQSQITGYQVTASGIPSLTIDSENASQVYQGLTNTTLGNATVSVSGTNLVITNLGSTGQDGVSIAMSTNITTNVNGMATGWQTLDVSNTLPVGAYVQSQIVGPLSGGTNGAMGTVQVTKAGIGNYTVTADFSPLGASNYVVAVYSAGNVVAQTTNQAGVSAGNSDQSSSGLGAETTCCPLQPYMTVYLPTGSHFTPTGGSTVASDALLIAPQNVSLVGPPTALQITASQVPALSIAGINVASPKLGIQSNGKNVTIQWQGNATLQQSSDLLHWSGVNGATSPYTITPVGSAGYSALVPGTPPIIQPHTIQ